MAPSSPNGCVVEPLAVVPGGQADLGPFKAARASPNPTNTIVRIRASVTSDISLFIASSQFASFLTCGQY